MLLSVFIVDAFTTVRFKGNPAAVVPLQEWLPESLMQAIASEHNLSETAFFVRDARGVFDIRWFSPLKEVGFCGHATLASALVIAMHQDAVFPLRPGGRADLRAALSQPDAGVAAGGAAIRIGVVVDRATGCLCERAGAYRRLRR